MVWRGTLWLDRVMALLQEDRVGEIPAARVRDPFPGRGDFRWRHNYHQGKQPGNRVFGYGSHSQILGRGIGPQPYAAPLGRDAHFLDTGY